VTIARRSQGRFTNVPDFPISPLTVRIAPEKIHVSGAFDCCTVSRPIACRKGAQGRGAPQFPTARRSFANRQAAIGHPRFAHGRRQMPDWLRIDLISSWIEGFS